MLVVDLGATAQLKLKELHSTVKDPAHRQLCMRRVVILGAHYTQSLLFRYHPRCDSLQYPSIVTELALELESELWNVFSKVGELRNQEVKDVVVVNDRFVGVVC